MDVSRIDMALVEQFDMAYYGAQFRYRVAPEEADKRTKKRMRKFVTRQYLKGESFPKQVMAYMNSSVNDEDFIAFLCACHQRVEEEGSRAENHFKRVTEDLPGDARYALRQLINTDGVVEPFRRVENDLYISAESGHGYEMTLIFHNATDLPKNYDMIFFQEQAIAKEENGYCLVGEAENWDDEVLKPFALHFTYVTAVVQVYPATEDGFFDNPWETLWSIMGGIVQKSQLPGVVLNAQEKELLPLFEEGICLSQWHPYREDLRFPLFKELCVQRGYGRLGCLLEGLEQAKSVSKYGWWAHKILKELSKEKYEPFWRELYGQVEQSQKGYPSRLELGEAPPYLQQVREEIQREMVQQGYEGTYPNFVKIGPMKGLHFVESHGMDYLVGCHKRVAYHIRCQEEIMANFLTVSFLCGTHLLKKEETSQDAFTCAFSQKGHRLFEDFSYTIERKKDVKELGKMVRIAVKKSQLQSLTKEEKQAITPFCVSAWKIFLLFFMLMGGLFAAMFTPAMMGMSALLTWLDGLPVVFFEPFWWWIFLFSWIGFGLPMAIIMTCARRK